MRVQFTPSDQIPGITYTEQLQMFQIAKPIVCYFILLAFVYANLSTSMFIFLIFLSSVLIQFDASKNMLSIDLQVSLFAESFFFRQIFL